LQFHDTFSLLISQLGMAPGKTTADWPNYLIVGTTDL